VSVLELQCLQALHVVGCQPREVLPPGVNGLLANFVLLRGFRKRRSFGLPENRHDLLVAESTLTHGLLAGKSHRPKTNGSKYRAQVTPPTASKLSRMRRRMDFLRRTPYYVSRTPFALAENTAG
jgi:hypothetical protein